MNISIIAAIGRQNELGKEGALLWNLPNDMAYFRNTTQGHAVVMGRKTYESILHSFGKSLPNRQNIVITRDTVYNPNGATIVHSLKEALEKVDIKNYSNEVFIIGGAQIYNEAIPYADTLYITHVDGSFDADTFFPEIDTKIWQKISEERHEKDEQHACAYSFCVYKRLITKE